MSADYPIIHGEALPPFEVCPEYEHGLDPSWRRAHLERVRAVAKSIIAHVWKLDRATLDVIAALAEGGWSSETTAKLLEELSTTMRLRALQQERLRSLKETT